MVVVLEYRSVQIGGYGFGYGFMDGYGMGGMGTGWVRDGYGMNGMGTGWVRGIHRVPLGSLGGILVALLA